MIVQPSLPSGYVIFCDDIRHEVNNKVTFVGTYTGDMIAYGVGSATISQLFALIVYRDDPTTFPKKVSFRAFKQGSETETLLTADIEIPAEAGNLPPLNEFSDPDSIKFAEMRVEAKFSPLVINEACQLKVRVFSGDDEIRLGALNIRLEPPPEPPKPA